MIRARDRDRRRAAIDRRVSEAMLAAAVRDLRTRRRRPVRQAGEGRLRPVDTGRTEGGVQLHAERMLRST